VNKLRKHGDERLVIEVPKHKIKDFKEHDYVRVIKIEDPKNE
jgi:hypothetical protein